MAPEQNPADPDQGFPNPLHPDFSGERTPEEQHAFDEAQAREKAVAEKAKKATKATKA